MFKRIVLVAVLVLVAQPLTASAQLLRHRKDKGHTPQVVHVHHTSVQPVIVPSYSVESLVAVAPIVAAYRPVVQPTVQVPLVLEAPVLTASAVAIQAAPANRIPVRKPALVASRTVAEEIRLSNPCEGTVYFTINDTSFAMNPGESKSLIADRDLVIKFDNGNSRGLVYQLTAGSFEFTVNETSGWDLVKQSN